MVDQWPDSDTGPRTSADSADSWWSDDAATFGDRLAHAREVAGLTQEELSARLGVKVSTVARWEDDLSEPRANRLQMVAGMLGVSLSWIMTGRGEGPEALVGEVSEDVRAALAEMRELRATMQNSIIRLGQLEKKLRTGLALG